MSSSRKRARDAAVDLKEAEERLLASRRAAIGRAIRVFRRATDGPMRRQLSDAFMRHIGPPQYVLLSRDAWDEYGSEQDMLDHCDSIVWCSSWRGAGLPPVRSIRDLCDADLVHLAGLVAHRYPLFERDPAGTYPRLDRFKAVAAAAQIRLELGAAAMARGVTDLVVTPEVEEHLIPDLAAIVCGYL